MIDSNYWRQNEPRKKIIKRRLVIFGALLIFSFITAIATYFITKDIQPPPDPSSQVLVESRIEPSLNRLTIPLKMEIIVHYLKSDSMVATSTLGIEIQEIMNDWKRFDDVNDDDVNVTSIDDYDDNETSDEGSVYF